MLRIGSIIITFILLFTCMPFSNNQVFADDQKEGDFTFFDLNGDITITGYTGAVMIDLKIPDTLGGKPVKSIGNNAFEFKILTSVIIPDTVTSIGDSAFSNNYLKSVVIPSGVTTIGKRAFYRNSLTSVVIPNGVTTIGNGAFNYNKLSSITIPDSMTNVEDDAFSSNDLTSVTLPDSVTSIGKNAFQYNKLTSITIPNGVTSIGDWAFSTNSLMDVTIPDSVISIGMGAFYENQLTSVGIPDSVKNIGVQAFQYNLLTEVTIPTSVTKIENVAFAFNELTSVIIPDSVTEIEGNAFSYNQLTSVRVPKSVTDMNYDAFDENKPNFTIIGYNPSAAMNNARRYGHKFEQSNIYNVLYDGNGQTNGSEPQDPKKYELRESFVVLPNDNMVKTDHTFVGWNTGPDGSGDDYNTGDTGEVNGHLTLYAKWVLNKQTVNFDTYGGTAVADEIVNYGDKLTVPASTKIGYSLVGWYTDAQYATKWDFENDTVTGDMTLHAKWELNKYTVKFETNGGTIVSNVAVDHGTKVTKPTTPEKSGYSFVGWYTDTKYTNAWNFEAETVTSDMTLYTKWDVSGGGSPSPTPDPTPDPIPVPVPVPNLTPNVEAPKHIRTEVKDREITIQIKEETTGKWKKVSIEKTQFIGGYFIIQMGQGKEESQSIEIPKGASKVVVLENEKSYTYFDTVINTASNKEWIIKFSRPLQNNDVNFKSFSVHDVKGNKVELKVTFSKDGEIAMIMPVVAYEKGSLYYLTVADAIGRNGKKQKQPIRKIFIVKI